MIVFIHVLYIASWLVLRCAKGTIIITLDMKLNSRDKKLSRSLKDKDLPVTPTSSKARRSEK